MVGQILYDPLLPWTFIYVMGAASMLMLAYATWSNLLGWWLRAASLLALLAAIANPSIQEEDRQLLSDIVVAIIDESSSQKIGNRTAQNAAALEMLTAEIAARPNTEFRVKSLGDGESDAGTTLMSALSEVLSDEPQSRIAGAILVTDGQLHDADRAPDLPAPLHVLLTGEPSDWDRRLVVKNAPGFAIIGEEVELTIRIEDQGAVPLSHAGSALVELSLDGGQSVSTTVPTGQDLTLPVTLEHGGTNIIQFRVATADGELTDRNNTAVVRINGVRDRLRVLLVSGEPHPGERTWRNLLKSDSAVDLVHFTILRPPEKQDGVPVSELSLIAFPTRELFLEKIDEFDLIIFDRYKRRGILPSVYLRNVADYVRRGGAVLIAAGPDFAAAESIFRSPLAEIVPAAPTARVFEEGFAPQISEVGQRHPVTRGLSEFAPPGGWGRWLRLVEVEQSTGHAVMTGIDDRPLLVLDRVEEGRIALLASDHAWLWSRGYEGGGPQLELLRRLAHWMMKEPDLEEEALTATSEGQTLTITRRTLSEEVGEVSIMGPDGGETLVPVEEISPGLYQGTYDAPEIGLYRMTGDELASVAAVGPAAPREFEETVATGAKLEDIVAATGGGILNLSDGVPDLRNVRAGRPATGRNWIGITARDAYLTRDVSIHPILPAWAFLLIAASLMIAAWLLEGRRTRPRAA